MGKQAAAFGRAGLTRAAEIISAGLVEMRGATSPRLLLELMCAQVLLPAAGADTAGLAERLDRLERTLTASGRAARRQHRARRAGLGRAPGPGGRAPDTPAPGAPASGRGIEHGSSDAGSPSSRQRAPGSGDPHREPRNRRPASGGSRCRPRPPDWHQRRGRPAAAAQCARAGAGGDVPADTQALRTRWPDVLAAVQGRKRVAWMQLSNASVESFADGVLTLAFAQAGIAKGFVTGGYDKDLGQVLSDMFGVTPTIRTSVGDPGGSVMIPIPEPGSSYPPPPAAAQRPPRRYPAMPRTRTEARARRHAERPAGAGAAIGRPQQQCAAATVTAAAAAAAMVAAAPAAAQRRQRDAASGAPARPDPASASSASAHAADNEPAPGDRPAPDVLTGTDLIERELGGRIIQELDGP